MHLVLDLDGVIWLAGRPLPGSAGAVARLRTAGHRVSFVTNNGGPTVAEHLDALRAVGIEAGPDELITSSRAAASLLAPGSTATVVGGSGVTEALTGAGVHLVAAEEGPDAVVVGRTTDLDYDRLAAAATAIRAGARFVATNTDPTYPTPDGPVPGAGALVAFLTVASGVEPVVAGKPAAPVADLLRSIGPAVDVVVGDRPDTDGELARRVGARFALVLTGVTRPGAPVAPPAPDVVAADLAAVVEAVLAASDPPADDVSSR